MAPHSQTAHSQAGFIAASNPFLDLISTIEQQVQAHDTILILRRKVHAMMRLHRKAIDVMNPEARAKMARSLAEQFFYIGVPEERQPVSMKGLLLDIASEYWARLNEAEKRATAPITKTLARDEKTEYLALLALSESQVKIMCAGSVQ